MALSANRELDRYVDQELRALPVKGTTHVYKGALAGIDAGTGCARGLVAGDAFAGIAYEEMNNAGADSAESVRVHTEGDFEHTLAGASTANNGKPVYASADDTLTLTRGSNSFVGRQVSVASANKIVLRIQPGVPEPIAEQAALTADLTALTHTAPGSADYALQDLVQNTGFGFATADEGNTALSVLANVQARVADIEAVLVAIKAAAAAV